MLKTKTLYDFATLKMKKNSLIDIILPNRIGDCITSLPAVLCAKQLIEKFEPSQKLRIIPPKNMLEVVKAVDLCEVVELSWLNKLRSIINPPDKAFFLATTSQNIGYFAKKSFGERNLSKKLIRYSYDMPYLGSENFLNKELQDFLHKKHNIPLAQTRYFGLCLELGFTLDQIVSTFKFNPDKLKINKEILSWKPEFWQKKYIIFCMEAAYGRKHEFNRRWENRFYIEISEQIYRKYGLYSVFIGVENTPVLLDKPYIFDLRQKVTIPELVQVIKFSKGYIGNDTGPLHLVNLCHKPSIGVYLLTNPIVNGPIFPQFNYPVQNPESLNVVVQEIKKLIQE